MIKDKHHFLLFLKGLMCHVCLMAVWRVWKFTIVLRIISISAKTEWYRIDFFSILAQPLMLNRFIYYVKVTVVDLAVNRICRVASSNLLAVSDQWPRMPYEKQMPQACALLPWQQGTIKTLLEADHFKQMSKQQYNHLDTAIRRSSVWLLYQLDRNLKCL